MTIDKRLLLPTQALPSQEGPTGGWWATLNILALPRETVEHAILDACQFAFGRAPLPNVRITRDECPPPQVGRDCACDVLCGLARADAGFLALAIVGLISQEAQMVRAPYLAMDLIGWFVIVPFSFAALLTGLVLALGTPWGLFRHYWILVKFLFSLGAIIVLLVHTNAMREASRASGVAGETLSGVRAHLAASGAGGHLGDVQTQLAVAAGAGLLVLLTTTTLGVYKPWGKTRYARRMVSPS